MTSYLLLRNNKETGPFLIEELKAQNLKTTDLIWIEGESTAWKYPTELQTIKEFVATDDTSAEEPAWQTSHVITTSKGVFVALPQQRQSELDKEIKQSDTIAFKKRFEQPVDVLQERYDVFKKQKPFSSRKTFSKPHATLWLTCVFAGLVVAAFLIRNIVDTYNVNADGLSATAAVPVMDMDRLKSTPEENMYQNALTTEEVPVDTVTLKPLKKEAPKVDLKKLVRLEANDYEVGLLGGIKNLRMLVVNKSAFVLNNVSFQLQYLKPNGTVLKTENLALTAIAPKSSKSLALPANKRGVKIAYHITGIQSKQGSNALLQL